MDTQFDRQPHHHHSSARRTVLRVPTVTHVEQLCDSIELAITSLGNAYKGFLPHIETPDTRTRLMHIKDEIDRAFAALDRIRVDIKSP